jgi:hypothetical protein
MLVLAGAFSLAPILVIVGLQMADAASPAPATPLGPVLRLHDLQIGYQGGLECAPIERAEEPPSKLTQFIKDFKPQGCAAAYVRLFAVGGEEPDPPVVGSAVLQARSGAEAEAALAVLPLLIARIDDGHPPEEVAPTETIGETTRLFHLAELETEDPRADQASALIWRSGNVLAGVLVIGASSAANDRIAAIYAQRQQAHIETRTPYTAAERDNREVVLDDPHLPVDVLWLGHTFRPAHGLRAANLLSSYRADGRGDEPELNLSYGGELTLESWTRPGWQRHRRTPVGRLVRTWGCTKATTIQVPGGHAIVYAGYGADFATCPQRQPNAFLADVYRGRTVLTVDAPICLRCAVLSHGAYNSLHGMKAVVRSLRPRTPAAPR